MIGTYRFDRRTRSVCLAPAPMLPAQQFALRAEFGAEPWVDDDGPLECPGRFISDSTRAAAGMTTSRIFGVKTDTDGNPATCGPWICWGDALESLSILVDVLWDTHQFLVDGEPVGTKEQVMEAFRQDLQVSFVTAV